MKKTALMAMAALMLAALPAFAGPDVIERGLDLWRTTGDGSTKVDFRFDPIPAGFFCKGSEPFTGTIGFRGVPVATVPEGILGSTDTLVERLDDAAFDANGIATTRIRVRSMSFEGLAPVQTSCGAFNVTVGLNGEQPFTEMRIVKETAAGGSYAAPVSVNIRMTFERQDGKGWPVHLDREMRFRAIPNAEWTMGEASKLASWGELFVDTDSDGLADSYVPAPTSFLAGSNLRASSSKILEGGGCHCDYAACGHQHCISSCGGGGTHRVICADER